MQTKANCVEGCCNLAAKEVMDHDNDDTLWDVTPQFVLLSVQMGCTGDNAVTDPCLDDKLAVAIGAR